MYGKLKSQCDPDLDGFQIPDSGIWKPSRTRDHLSWSMFMSSCTVETTEYNQEPTSPPFHLLKKKQATEAADGFFVSLRQFPYYYLLSIVFFPTQPKFCYDITVECNICIFSQCDHLSLLRSVFYFQVFMKYHKYILEKLTEWNFTYETQNCNSIPHHSVLLSPLGDIWEMFQDINHLPGFHK